MRKQQESKKSGESSARQMLSAWTSGYLVLLFLVLPLAVGPGGYETILDVKYGLFLWASRVYVAGIPLLWLELLLTGQEKPPRLSKLKEMVFHLGAPRGFLLAYAVLCAISALLSPFPETVWGGGPNHFGLETILLLTLVFFGIFSFGTWKSWYAGLFAGAALLNGVVAALQLLGNNPLGLFPEGVTYADAGTLYSGEYLGLIGNADLFSAYGCLAVPLLFCAFVKERGVLRWVSLAGGTVGLLALLASRVAGGVVGLLGTAFLLLPLFLKLAAGRFGWKHPVRAGLLLQLFLAVLGLVILWFWPGQAGTLYEFSQLLHGQVQDSFGSSRIAIWRDALSLVPSAPLFGGGPDTYAQRSGIVFTRLAAGGAPFEVHLAEAHSEYLNILVNTGLLSLAAYLGALLLSLWRGLCRAAQGERISLMLAAPVLCYGVQAFFGIASCITFPLFWVLWALLAGTAGAKTPVFIKRE